MKNARKALLYAESYKNWKLKLKQKLEQMTETKTKERL